MFKMPVYHHPDFTQEKFQNAPNVNLDEVVQKGVAPEGDHSTSM